MKNTVVLRNLIKLFQKDIFIAPVETVHIIPNRTVAKKK